MNKTLSNFIEKFKCALCDCEITNDTDSKEHVIPQSIGGRLVVKGFICKVCNNTKGDSWDAELARLLNFFSLFLGISRERGEPPSQLVRHMDTNGNFRELVFLPDGSYTIPKPIYKVTSNGDVPQLSIQAANIKQFLISKMLQLALT
ncbi:MAG: HNH endonuclease [Methylovulum miyakonense]|uniref:HNH endonuclease n=1 Tax=Methylovulum miyakonense TaxID=645578 RepID=UPI003BB662F1